MSEFKKHTDLDIEYLEKQVEKIKRKGFNPIGYTQMYFEETYIFETSDEASLAFKTLEQNVPNKSEMVVGWWYGKEDFLEEEKRYNKESKEIGVKMDVRWFNVN